uniref:Uncharacterized protein n=1 Tax=Arundo donax TaxID=35708 RepID=A0A0A8Y744_ARUDO
MGIWREIMRRWMQFVGGL